MLPMYQQCLQLSYKQPKKSSIIDSQLIELALIRSSRLFEVILYFPGFFKFHLFEVISHSHGEKISHLFEYFLKKKCHYQTVNKFLKQLFSEGMKHTIQKQRIKHQSTMFLKFQKNKNFSARYWLFLPLNCFKKSLQ